MLKPKVNKMIQKLGSTPTGRLKDTDRDGVPNVLDCKPYNKRKQGIIHRVGARIARKAGATGAAQRIERREEEVEERRGAVRKIRKEERLRQAKETALYKEQQRGKRQREFARRGGYAGAIGKSLRAIPKSTPGWGITTPARISPALYKTKAKKARKKRRKKKK